MDSHSGYSNKPSSHSHKPQPSPKDLLSSAKVMAGAAKSTLHHDTEKIDKAKVADAAADLLGAASHYGKFEEKKFGKYVEKAENYLHQYHSSHPSTTAAAAHHSSSAHSRGEAHSESDFGDYLKLAQGFLKKH
ncbi:nodulin-related protein 1 [Elaeis guineensis]|uniref:Nodulin-related protein 1 n=1 Tax=Elaeis guineensis var. tenera TaxID=51953 RepID=A0A6I9S278_ELAGV|nr:nodulin-related protein 1 [Elaeis guineensis]